MTVKELINKLLDQPMDAEAELFLYKEHKNESENHRRGQCFKIESVKPCDPIWCHIVFKDSQSKIQENSMSVRELINKLLDQRMDARVDLFTIYKEHRNEHGYLCQGYWFKVEYVESCDNKRCHIVAKDVRNG